MNTTDRTQPESASEYEISSLAFFVDLALYLSVMFLIREVYFPSFGFLANGLFWSLTTLGVATWRMRARGVTWVELGLCKPKHIKESGIGHRIDPRDGHCVDNHLGNALGLALVGFVAGHFQ